MEQPPRMNLDPIPEQQPWRSDSDAKGWHVVYRGNGRPRQITSSIVIELTAEQDDWVDAAAEIAGLMPHEFISKLIESARLASQPGDSVRSAGA